MSSNDIVTLNDYQLAAMSNAVHVEKGQSTIGEVPYGFLGLVGEMGEAANVLKKYLRGSITKEVFTQRFTEEMGDALWYFVDILDAVYNEFEINIELRTVARANIAKLEAKKKGDPDWIKKLP